MTGHESECRYLMHFLLGKPAGETALGIFHEIIDLQEIDLHGAIMSGSCQERPVRAECHPGKRNIYHSR